MKILQWSVVICLVSYNLSLILFSQDYLKTQKLCLCHNTMAKHEKIISSLLKLQPRSQQNNEDNLNMLIQYFHYCKSCFDKHLWFPYDRFLEVQLWDQRMWMFLNSRCYTRVLPREAVLADTAPTPHGRKCSAATPSLPLSTHVYLHLCSSFEEHLGGSWS